jgi:ABC-type uncharacterized transport system permease subunit
MNRWAALRIQLFAPLLALVAAFALSSAILAATGNSPFDVFDVIVNDGFKTKPIVEMLNRAAPYYIAGVAVAIGFRMNLFNIGVEGQYRVAALVGAFFGAKVALPGPLHVPFILLVSMITGALWALIPALLKVTRGVSEVISSIMLNSIALGFMAFLLRNWFHEKGPGLTGAVGTAPLPDSGRLPLLNDPLERLGIDFPPGARLQSYLFVAIAVGVVYRILIWRTTFGFDLRATGSSPEAAQASGVNSKRMIVTAMLLSGGTAGLIGLNNILSNTGTQARYTDLAVPASLGFTGIAIALLGRNHPVGIAFAALLWAFMDALQTPLQSAGLPKQITAILQGVILLSVVIAYEMARRLNVRREAAALRRDLGEAPPPPPEPSAGGLTEVPA